MQFSAEAISGKPVPRPGLARDCSNPERRFDKAGRRGGELQRILEAFSAFGKIRRGALRAQGNCGTARTRSRPYLAKFRAGDQRESAARTAACSTAGNSRAARTRFTPERAKYRAAAERKRPARRAT